MSGKTLVSASSIDAAVRAGSPRRGGNIKGAEAIGKAIAGRIKKVSNASCSIAAIPVSRPFAPWIPRGKPFWSSRDDRGRRVPSAAAALGCPGLE
jgi:ribosomal protein L18